jgi:hypothetical protein
MLAVPSAHAVVAAGEKDTNAVRTELRKQIVHRGRIFRWEIRLQKTIRHADRLRDSHLAENVVEPVQEHVAHAWFIATGRPSHQAAGAVVHVRSRVRRGLCVLDFDIRLCVRIWMARIVSDPHGSGVCGHSVFAIVHIHPQIRLARILLQ